MDDDEYLPNDDAAGYLHQSKTTLPTWRARGQGPAYVKIGRKVFYKRSALDAFIAASTIDPALRNRGAA